jgi:nicotinate-nucleotide pyrophosphorylase (carboxylating)
MRLEPPLTVVEADVRQALKEDLSEAGDLTAALIPAEALSEASVICREAAVISGIPWFSAVFHQLDPNIEIQWLVKDGEAVMPNQTLCQLQGNSRLLLSGERTALNFLQTLSGTATQVAAYVAAVAGTQTRILDTRKTLPGLRLAQKYAVRCGGGSNHRVGLYDAILIKENHIQAAGSIAAALTTAQAQAPAGVEIEVEVENLDELKQALDAGAKRVLLDNFSLAGLREAVALNQGRARLEASGNVDLKRIRGIAETGVDDISIGALTKHLRAVDLSMRFKT